MVDTGKPVTGVLRQSGTMSGESEVCVEKATWTNRRHVGNGMYMLVVVGEGQITAKNGWVGTRMYNNGTILSSHFFRESVRYSFSRSAR
jgi:hypothetical protein